MLFRTQDLLGLFITGKPKPKDEPNNVEKSIRRSSRHTAKSRLKAETPHLTNISSHIHNEDSIKIFEQASGAIDVKSESQDDSEIVVSQLV